MDFIKKNGAGMLLCLCIAIPAWLLGQAVPVVGGPVFSILIGMVLTLFWKNKTKVQPGIGFTSKKVLQSAVSVLIPVAKPRFRRQEERTVGSSKVVRKFLYRNFLPL